MSKVIVRNADYETATGVIDQIFKDLKVNLKGKSVLLKPNFGAAVAPTKAASTDARLVKSVLDVCLKQTSDVVIGDNPGNLDKGAMNSVKMSGILDLAPNYYENISKDGEFVDIGSQIIPKAFISKKISEVDYLINIPKWKTHVLVELSCCLKNLFGYVVGATKSKYHVETGSLLRLVQFWMDLYKYRKPDLNIVDGIISMEGGGPTHGFPRNDRKIVAGENGLEVDVVMMTMMGFDPKANTMLRMYHEQGLGEIDIKKIDVVGDFEILPEFKRPPTFAVEMLAKVGGDAFAPISKVRPVCDEDLCIQCNLCEEESCPAGAIALNPYPIINPEKCISCYCCVEFCPEGALSVPYDRAMMESI